MKIALVHIRHKGTGGTERYLNLLAAHLAEAGHEVTIVCRSHEDAPHPAVRFHVLRRAVVGGAWRAWAFAKDVEAHVARSAYDVVYALGRTWSHDLIRLGGGCHASYLELAHDKTLRPWELGGRRLKNSVTLRIECKALAPGAYQTVVTNSELVKRDVMRRFAVPEERIEVLYNGVDLERFRPGRSVERATIRAEAGIDKEARVALFLGTGYARKGLDRALRAMVTIAREAPDVTLLVVGYDGQRSRWEAESRELGIAGQVRFLGGRRDAEACFAAGDVYVLPTRYDPFANSTLEALASGLPVITTRTNGGSEIVRPDQGSVIENDDDPSELTAALRGWLAPGVADEARAACRTLAEGYSAERQMQRSAELCEAARAAKARGAQRP